MIKIIFLNLLGHTKHTGKEIIFEPSLKKQAWVLCLFVGIVWPILGLVILLTRGIDLELLTTFFSDTFTFYASILIAGGLNHVAGEIFNRKSSDLLGDEDNDDAQ